MNDSDIEIRLTTRLDDLRGDMRRAESVVNQSLGGMRRELSGFSSQMGTLRNIIIGSGLVLLGRQTIGVMSNFEQLEIRLNGVMGSVAAGKKSFAWIKQFTSETPYQVDQVAESFVRLKAFGLDPMDGTMQALSDTAAKIGGDYQTLEGITLAMGQAWAKQKLQGEEILQLVERGVPVWDMLAKVTGKSTAELQKLSEKGKLGRDVMAALIDEMGRMNAGSAGALMDSLSGQYANFVDNIKNALDDVRGAGGLGGIKRNLADVNDWFSQANQDGRMKQYAANISQVLNQVSDLVREMLWALGELLQVGVDVFSGLGAAAGDSSTAQQDALSPLGVALETLRVLFIGFGTSVRLIWHNLKFATMELVSELEGVWSSFSAFFDVLVEQISSPITRLKMRIDTFAEAASRALKGDFSGAAESWRAGLAEIEAEVDASRKRIEDRYSQKAQEQKDSAAARTQMRADWEQGNFDIGQDANDRINRQGAHDPFKFDPNADTGSAGGGGSSSGSNTGTTVSTGGGASVSSFSAELATLKANYQLQSGLRKLSIADEIAFWQRKGTLVEMGSKEAGQIEQKILQLQVRQAQQAHDQRIAIDEAGAEAQQKIAEERLKTAEQTAQMEADFGLVSQQEYLQRLVDIEAQRYEIARTALDDRLALLAVESEANQAEMVRLQGELEVLREQHNQRLAEIDSQAMEESMSLWTELGDSMNNLWNQGLEAMLNGTLTWKNAMNAIWAEVGRVFLMKVVTEPLKKWAAAQATKLAMQMGFLQTEQAAESVAAATSVSTTASAAMAKVGANAAVAGSGAASSQASIPYIGPILAIAAMGAIIASVMALKGNIKSARGGYDIPAGINPVTQLHEQEMVLPAEHANTIRGLGEEGEGGGMSVQIKGERLAGGLFMAREKELQRVIQQMYRKNMLRPT